MCPATLFVGHLVSSRRPAGHDDLIPRVGVTNIVLTKDTVSYAAGEKMVQPLTQNLPLALWGQVCAAAGDDVMLASILLRLSIRYLPVTECKTRVCLHTCSASFSER